MLVEEGLDHMLSFLCGKWVVWSMEFIGGTDTDDEFFDTMGKGLLDSVQVSVMGWLDTGNSESDHGCNFTIQSEVYSSF